MKKSLTALLILISVLFSLFSCGSFVPANKPENPTENPNPNPNPSPNPNPTPDEGLSFTVKVMLDGKEYTEANKNPEKPLMVRWTDGITAHTANIDDTGLAAAKGLDGDYDITLLNIPKGYTYNANIYRATNDSPDVTIELIKITPTIGDGDELYGGCIQINKTGTYRAEIKKSGRVVYYEFKPPKQGVYKIESMVAISTNMYNPVLKIYNGTKQYKLEVGEVNDGGVGGSYTKNFLHELEIDSIGMNNVYTFAVRVEGKDAVYPTYVDFTLTYMGSVEDAEEIKSELMIPEYIPGNLNYFDMCFYDTIDEEYLTTDDLNNPTYKWLKEYREYLQSNKERFGFASDWIDAAERVDGKKVFNDDDFRLNPADKYYHLYDEEKYAESGGWGPILYADIDRACLFMGESISTMEYAGNKALTVSNGTENYKLFVEGSYELTKSHGDSGPYFCNSTCTCYKAYKTELDAFSAALSAYVSAKENGASDLSAQVSALRNAKSRLLQTEGGFCDKSCTKCNDSCFRLPEENKFQMGYANICVDGRAPVTEELKEFLQKLSESERYFADGMGWIEGQGYTAFEDSQWLFACGYYH